MSFDAVEWALAQPIERSSAKFVLVAMASCVNGKGGPKVSFPSTAHLCTITAQDRKTVLANIKVLKDLGYLIDTGEHVGRTGQITVFTLNDPNSGTVPRSPVDDSESTENGTLSKVVNSAENGTLKQDQKRDASLIETVPLFPSNSTVFPMKESQISHERVPKTGHVIRKEQGKEKGKEQGKEPRAKKRDEIELLAEVDPQIVADYLVVRKAKKAGPLTATAIAGLRREAGKAGITIAAAVEFCCEAGWQGFRADWYANRRGETRRPFAHRSTDQRNYEENFDAVPTN